MAADKIQKRVAWLNEHCFADRPINDDAVAAMIAVGQKKAMELFKELEEKKDNVQKPSGFLAAAARREGFAPADAAGGKGKGGGKHDKKHKNQGHQQPEATGAAMKITKRVAWLNEHHFTERPIDEQSVAALVGMGIKISMEILKELEEKKDEVKKPSHFIKNRARKEGFAPPDSVSSHGGGKGNKGKGGATSGGGGGSGGGEGAAGKINGRAQWLNEKFFAANPIDADALAAMVGMGKNRAFELFKELETKKPHNPSGYLKAAARREGFGPPEEAPAAPKGGHGKGHSGKSHAGKGKGKHSGGGGGGKGGAGSALGAALALVGNALGAATSSKGAGSKGKTGPIFSSTTPPAPLVGMAHKGGNKGGPQKGGQKGQGKAGGKHSGLPKPPMPMQQGTKRVFQSNVAGGAPPQKRMRPS